MKITGIEIGDYRQFKNIKFDFTYPEGHAKAGQPLEKVCFIGQSGTGKTTLLKSIFDFISYLDELESLPFGLDHTSWHVSGLNKTCSVRYILDDEEAEYVPFSDYNINSTQDILSLYMPDNLIEATESFLYNGYDETEQEAITSREILRNRPNQTLGLHSQFNEYRVLNLIRFYNENRNNARYSFFDDIIDFDSALKNTALSIINNSSGISAEALMQRFIDWKNQNPNPRFKYAEQCLNPILSRFYLEVDIDAADAPIIIKTLSNVKIDGAWLSTGTKQVIAASLALYKVRFKNPVIFFDEPERSLFPDIQRELIKHYTGLAPEAQFFFATHSPIIAAAFEPEERFILYFDENGEVKFRNGVAPIGDDPNDVLRKDFGMNPLVPAEGVEAYQTYLELATKIKNESDIERRMELIAERSILGNKYDFPQRRLMRRIEKKADSLILKENLSYQKRDGERIAEILRAEQHCICAYTEEYLGRADKADVEHFDPTLKPTDNDGYENWFLVKAQWNTEKGRTARWLNHQPLLYPTAEDFEKRILYEKGNYILADENDIEARNLRSYLKLDDEAMIQQRVDYIDRMQEDIVLSGLSNQEFIDWRLATNKYQNTIYYIRAIQEELQVTVNFDLLKIK